MIDVGAQPMCVRNRILRTGSDQQPLVARQWLTRMMTIKGEAALQAALDVRMMLEPASMRREVVAVGQVVALGESLERQIRQRRRRFADREARMGPPFYKNDFMSSNLEHARHDRARESTSDHGNAAAIAH